jgi:GAF domain-containing protein
MDSNKKTGSNLIEELESLRKQVAHLRDGNQQAVFAMEKRTAELRALSAIGQATAVETGLDDLYHEIHEVIKDVIGHVNLMIATYHAEQNQIEIPYAFEEGQHLQIDPFPLGEGLTSILIRTGQALMIVEDTVNKARALGAKIAGTPARSWLGAPLMVGGHIIGAIIVQDLENEHRFDEDDKRLLSALAAQVAVAIRNVSLIEDMRAQSDRERLLFDITGKIRRSIDIQSILQITAREVGRSLGVRSAVIEINSRLIAANPEIEGDRDMGNATL